MTEPSVRKIAEYLDPLVTPGGLFDVEPNPLDLNVGKFAVVRQPEYPNDWQVWHLDTVQKIYNGTLAYRVSSQHDPYGRPLRPENADIFDTEQQAQTHLAALMRQRVGSPATYMTFRNRPKYVRVTVQAVVPTADTYAWQVRSASGKTRTVPATTVGFQKL